MDESDLKLYLKAKKQNSTLNRFVSLLLYIFIACYILINTADTEFQYLDSIAFGVFLVVLMQNKDFRFFGSAIVTNKGLLEIIENSVPLRGNFLSVLWRFLFRRIILTIFSESDWSRIVKFERRPKYSPCFRSVRLAKE